jgi:hypothetical protein
MKHEKLRQIDAMSTNFWRGVNSYGTMITGVDIEGCGCENLQKYKSAASLLFNINEGINSHAYDGSLIDIKI